MAFTRSDHLHYLIAVGAGLLVAFLGRFVFAQDILNDGGNLMMLSFLVLIPFSLGAVVAHFTPTDTPKWWRFILGPLFTVLLFSISALIFHLEGLICVLIIFPLFMPAAFIGAWLYAALTDGRRKDDTNAYATAFVVLPFLAAPLESQLAAPNDHRRVENTIVIEASAAVVWQNIIRVPPIQAADLGESLVDDIGFPRPVEATLTHEGVGGVRHATFERGVEFVETVDDWQPLRRLSFSIVPNTATIPPTTFDEHVIVGGRFFDVLRGTYELEPAGAGRTRLVLYSQQRLSTRLNPYAGLWTDYVMSEVQRRILAVIKKRCEA